MTWRSSDQDEPKPSRCFLIAVCLTAGHFSGSVASAQVAMPAPIPPAAVRPGTPIDLGASVRPPAPPAPPGLLGANHGRLERLPDVPALLGDTPRPSAATAAKFGRFVDKVIDPENTFDVIVNRPRILVLKDKPTAYEIADDQIASVSPKFDFNQISVAGVRPGMTVLNLLFPDPNDPADPNDPGRPRKQIVLSYLVRVLPDPEEKERLDRVYAALGKEINRLFPDSVVRFALAGDKLVISGQAKDIVEATQILRIARANAPGNANEGGIGPAGALGAGGGQVAATGINPASGALVTQTQPIPGVGGDLLPTLDNYQVAGGPNVINLLRVPGEQQVMLRVTVAEINRTASRSIGVDFSVLNRGGSTVFSQGLVNNGTSGNAANISANGNITAVMDNGRVNAIITALRTLNFARTLAEPNLVAINGQAASFQAGGQFPVPVTTGSTFAGLQGVSYVPFGVQLRFVPYITDKDRVRLSVSANVSTRDPSTGTTIGTSSVAGLTTRNFQSTIELRDGQTLAVAGLIQNSYGASSVRVPGIGDLPIIGRLGALDANSYSEQELVVLITPTLVHPFEGPDLPPLPGSDVFEPGDLEFYLLGRLESRRDTDYRSGVRTDIHKMIRYRHGDDVFIAGPHGHSIGAGVQP